MLLSEVLKLRRDRQSGLVSLNVLRALRLPMPDDVLEQFLVDHGTKPEFQSRYGNLDLHGV